MKKLESLTNLSGKCYQEIQNHILDGILAPGEKLTIEKLKTRYAVGHTPIREALSRLVDSHLVELQENRGFYVTAVSEADVRDIYATFTAIENLALKKAIELGDDAWGGAISAALYELALVEKNGKNVEYSVWRERNYAFHLALIAGCNSPCLLAMRNTLYKRFDRYCRMSFYLENTDLKVNHEEHALLAQAVLNRDSTTAVQLMAKHLNDPLEDIIRTLKNKKIV